MTDHLINSIGELWSECPWRFNVNAPRERMQLSRAVTCVTSAAQTGGQGWQVSWWSWCLLRWQRLMLQTPESCVSRPCIQINALTHGHWDYCKWQCTVTVVYHNSYFLVQCRSPVVFGLVRSTTRRFFCTRDIFTFLNFCQWLAACVKAHVVHFDVRSIKSLFLGNICLRTSNSSMNA